MINKGRADSGPEGTCRASDSVCATAAAATGNPNGCFLDVERGCTSSALEGACVQGNMKEDHHGDLADHPQQQLRHGRSRLRKAIKCLGSSIDSAKQSIQAIQPPTWTATREAVKTSLNPWVVIVPLVLLALCVTAGVIGVLTISDSIAAQRREDATNEANGRATGIVGKLERASLPAHGMAHFIRDTPGHDWQIAKQGFADKAEELIDLLSGSGLSTGMSISVAPGAIVDGFYPLKGNEAAIGHNLLLDPTQRENALVAINTRDIFLAGPYRLLQGYMAAIVRLPIFVNGTEYGPNVTFGSRNNSLPYNCPQCFGQQRFWGFAVCVMNWDAILNASKLRSLGSAGYKYRLTRPAQGTEKAKMAEYVLSQSDELVNATLGNEFIPVRFQALTTNWTLYIYQEDDWYPTWRWPLIVVVVVVSVILAGLVALVMGWNRRLKGTTVRLEEERQRLDALLVRQYELINCFGRKDTHLSHLDSMDSSERNTMDKIMTMRKSLQQSGAAQLAETEKIQIQQILGHGSYGKVYRGLWRGSTVAVKCLVMPAAMSRSQRAEKMAVMEAAISSSMCHPHVVQTYTYSICPLLGKDTPDGVVIGGSQPPISGSGVGRASAKATAWATLGSAAAAEAPSEDHGFEMRLVLEYCDRGSLRDVLDQGIFFDTYGFNYAAVLETAADIAKGMLHLHLNHVLHSDLKASNVMLKSGGSDGRGVLAKVVDFGLAIKLESAETHVSDMYQGTLTHMAPEVLLEGKQSRAADVYSFGILMYELFTGSHPYPGVPKALLGHMIAHDRRRPLFAPVVPHEYQSLAERCWHHDPNMRPNFSEVLEELQAARARLSNSTRPLRCLDPEWNPYLAGGAVPLGSDSCPTPLGDEAVTVDSAREVLPLCKLPEGVQGGGSSSFYVGSAIVLTGLQSECQRLGLGTITEVDNEAAGTPRSRAGLASPGPASPTAVTVPLRPTGAAAAPRTDAAADLLLRVQGAAAAVHEVEAARGDDPSPGSALIIGGSGTFQSMGI